MVRARTLKGALRNGPDAALTYLAEDLASRLDSCEDPAERLSLTRAFSVVPLSIKEKQRASARLAREQHQSPPTASNLVDLVKHLRDRGAS